MSFKLDHKKIFGIRILGANWKESFRVNIGIGMGISESDSNGSSSMNIGIEIE